MKDTSSVNVSSIAKRVNPLILDPSAKISEATPAAKTLPFCIFPKTKLKRSFIFIRVSKDILKSVKEIGDGKLNIIIENALLEKLRDEYYSKYEQVIKLISAGE